LSRARSRRRACSTDCDAMTAEKATYLDTSALVKLAVREPESEALRGYLRRHRPLISSALAGTEVARALLPLGPKASRRGHEVIAGIDIVRINDRVLKAAGAMLPEDLRSLDAIHLATAEHWAWTLHGSSPTTNGWPQPPALSAGLSWPPAVVRRRRPVAGDDVAPAQPPESTSVRSPNLATHRSSAGHLLAHSGVAMS
jgi:predicted nucleic acid-binding protein